MNVAGHLHYTIQLPERERELARELASKLDVGTRPFSLRTPDGHQIELPQAIVSAIAEAATLMADGNAIAIVPQQSELSPNGAAKLLNVSRPYLNRLLDQGIIPFHRVGSHRRVRLNDVEQYRKQRDSERREELRRLSKMSRELGIPE